VKTLALVCSAALVLLSSPARSQNADLVIWWDKGFFPQEDQSLASLVAGYEQESGKDVEFVQTPISETMRMVTAALAAGQPPDIASSAPLNRFVPGWAFDDRLADLSAVIGPREKDLVPIALTKSRMKNGTSGQVAYYAVPIGQTTTHIHVWRNMLQDAGIDPGSIPPGWDEFWSFWCEQVQPAVRRSSGRDDLFAVGLPMSGESNDTTYLMAVFIAAHGADYVTPTGELTIDEPVVRERLIRALQSYTDLYLKGCVPPDATTWSDVDNNKKFLEQRVVMTANGTLSIVAALKNSRPDDYTNNAMTITWPADPDGNIFPIEPDVPQLVVFKQAPHPDAAQEFLTYLLSEGRLDAHLRRTGRFAPVTRTEFESPFWQQSGDPHLTVSITQLREREPAYTYVSASGNPNHSRVTAENVWAKAVARVVADKASAEEAVDEAILRIKQIVGG
jgi:multiple sugar transport system substrate-binding protein